MTNEIKEILEFLKDKRGYYKTLTQDKIKQLLDYITNLQNENMKYDQCLTEITDNYKDLQKELTNLQEENENLLKKSYSDDVRITKAIEVVRLCNSPCAKETIQILQGENK